MQYELTAIARRATMAVAVIGAAACDSARTVQPSADPTMVVHSEAAALNAAPGDIMIDDFNSGAGTFLLGAWWGYKKQTEADILGGARQHGSYNYSWAKIDVTDGTLEWGTTMHSNHHQAAYGTEIGAAASGTGSNPDTGVPLNLSLSLQDEIVAEVVSASPWGTHFEVFVKSGTGEPFSYYTPLSAAGQVRAKLANFKSKWTNQPMTTAAASDVDGIRFFGIYHKGTKFSKFWIDASSAPTTTTVTFGPGPFVYSGSAFTATASVTPAAAGAATITYSGDCVNAGGTCTATATFAGSGSYTASSATASITIAKAPTTTTVTFGPGPFVYSGTAFTATASVSPAAAGSATIAYSGNCINAGNTCQATATYAGTSNFLPSSATTGIVIKLPVATSADQCKNGGWQFVTDDLENRFTNQGDCVSYVASKGRNKGTGG
jgi:hypothetical protein